MAAGYACMADGEPHGARWLLTSLDPPATFTSCDQDLPLMMIPVLAANLDTDPDRLYDAIRRHLYREDTKATKAAKAAAAAADGDGQADDDPPDPPDHDPGPEVDDEGGMSEHRHPDPETVIT